MVSKTCAARAASVEPAEGVVDGGKAQADKTQHTHLEVQGPPYIHWRRARLEVEAAPLSVSMELWGTSGKLQSQWGCSEVDVRRR